MRAILLAAGMGTRLRPLTYTTPKSLTIVNGEPLLERQIRFLHEIGINEIIVVTGYLSNKFDYLNEKYNVTLVYNDKYNVYNNVYTMYLVRNYLPDAYVIDADNYLSRNFLIKEPKTSLYFSSKKPYVNEWALCINREKKVTDIIVSEKGDNYILCGVSYWSKSDGELIRHKLEETIEHKDFKELFWDDVVKENIEDLNVYVQEINIEDTYEIDSLKDLEQVRRLFEL
ncbi:MAG: sugar phosphate nucleotidyltransferase [Caldibacillus thermoamylovorans]|jgi:CTP:phosphocholine cytidylyltransferase-like protein